MSSEKSAWVVKPPHVEPLKVLGHRMAVLADGAATGGPEVFLQSGVEGTGPVPHSHAWDEAYYMLDGAIELTVAGQAPVLLSAGEFIYLPGGTLHGFKVKTATARFLSFNSASGASKFFGEVSRELGDQLDIPRMLAIGGRHGVHTPPPPKAH